MITRTEVDGIPALVAPTTGPMHAGLVFRVGHADEPLARRGITHLIEHLALFSFGVADYHYNGTTGVEHTFFHMQGAEDDIVAFLHGVCAGLHDLPMHRLATEKEILRTEENGHGESAADALALWRHGARDHGMPGYPEWGLTGLTPDDLRAWTARYFNRQNAALWIAGPGVPAGLELKLPEGTRRPVPTPSSALPVRPAYFVGGSDVVAWDAVVERGQSTAVFADLLKRSLFRSLRQESGLSYNVHTEYTPRAGGRALLTAVADSLPEKQDAVLGGFVDVLAAARLGRFDPAEVATVVGRRREELARAEEAGGRLPGQVFNLLDGRPVQSLDEVLAELDTVTRDSVAAVAAAACADGLLMTPGRGEADGAGYTAAPTGSEQAVEGTTYPALGDPEIRLTTGETGLTLAREDSMATVLFAECSAVLQWPDGARRFVGHDAIHVQVEPALFLNGPELVAALDARTLPELRVPMPARGPDRIPRPPAPTPAERPPNAVERMVIRAIRRVRGR
ncbi:insulinase family protein [Actinoplanes hulinensis]|uniref:Insulinase family protein n=1 Tax=Actinoplanes hulinensis TaxID=1144547 RepID=A0ABS7AUY6_9ACTN|nr:insulinase family protein [Actinoplanes hulinensis]MBW6432599.1 insulinase family protein [Actinoplanes hulinensis]